MYSFMYGYLLYRNTHTQAHTSTHTFSHADTHALKHVHTCTNAWNLNLDNYGCNFYISPGVDNFT